MTGWTRGPHQPKNATWHAYFSAFRNVSDIK
ncbi:MAG: hypothetical protein QOC72_90 [Methylobacteriaceae bacterium]|jgi:hypothetical protein|nr:hypothetical protein [Methylobacteriaceae bacterium]